MSKAIEFIKERGFFAFAEKCFYTPYDRYIRKIQRPKRKQLYSYIKTSEYPDVELYNKKKENNVVISVTSFPKRFDQLVESLKSIILQDITPGRIIVYLGLDSKPQDITEPMRSLEQYGVEYRIDDSLNLKGHKKYYYALQEFSNKLVITIDDDIIFPPTMITELLNTHKKYPFAVCARRVHRITHKNGLLLPYSSWDIEYSRNCKPSNRIIATTGAGTLYSPDVIKHLPPEVFDANMIQKLCLEADDIWMKCMEVKASVKVVSAEVDVMGAFIHVDEQDTLMLENVGNNRNDVFLNNVIEYYGIDKRLLFRN